jgi:hypothetical protein
MLSVEDPGNTITYTPNELNQVTRIDKSFDNTTYTKTYPWVVKITYTIHITDKDDKYRKKRIQVYKLYPYNK